MTLILDNQDGTEAQSSDANNINLVQTFVIEQALNQIQLLQNQKDSEQ